jgi:hypothetical protein
MFQPRSSEFDPRVSAIADHLRAIETELGAIGKIAGRRASSGASAAANQVVDAILPILGDLTDRVRRGQQTALAEAKGVGADAVKAGVRVGNDALDRLGDQARQRPLFTMAVTLGIGVLIGFATRWDWNE